MKLNTIARASHRPKFYDWMVTPAKRAVRYDLYHGISIHRDPVVPGGSLLYIPGRAEQEELRMIRRFMPGFTAVAFDQDEGAVEIARKAGADETFHGDLSRVNIRGAAEYQARRNFYFANLDLCCMLKVKDSDVGYKNAISAVARRTERFLSVFVSYSREKDGEADFFKENGSLWRRFAESRMAQGMPWTSWYEGMASLADGLIGRADWVRRTAGRGMNIVRVYLYRGNQTHMLGVVLDRSPDSRPWGPLVKKITDADLPRCYQQESWAAGKASATALFGERL